MKKIGLTSTAFAILLVLVIATPAFAAPKAPLLQRDTWDADMIDSNITGYTGEGVYIAVLDTGLAPNWKDYFPVERIASNLGKGFVEDIKWDPKTQTFTESGFVHETSWIGDTGSTHGTHVTSTIIGYNYQAPADAASGFPLPPLFIKGIAPDATIIPVKVLADYHIGKSQTDEVNYPAKTFVMGTDRAVAAGIIYATNLKLAGYKPMIITMSLGGPSPAKVMEDAINYATSNGVIVVAAAGNEGDAGMSYPGAYQQVISVGSCGWRYEWYWPSITSSPPPPPRYRLWWLQDSNLGYNDIPEGTPSSDVYISEFSSRQKIGQDLDVVAPGSWVRGPMPGIPGYAHLPWWSNGRAWYYSAPGLTNFYYVGGTSMATPHVAGVIAQMLEKDGALTQLDVEYILKTTALPIPPGTMSVYDLNPTEEFRDVSWGVDATGSGLVQAKAAIDAIAP